MAYRIELERQAQKALAQLPKSVLPRIEAAIESLAEMPRPAGCRPVQTAPKGTYRIRVGDYRNEILCISLPVRQEVYQW